MTRAIIDQQAPTYSANLQLQTRLSVVYESSPYLKSFNVPTRDLGSAYRYMATQQGIPLRFQFFNELLGNVQVGSDVVSVKGIRTDSDTFLIMDKARIHTRADVFKRGRLSNGWTRLLREMMEKESCDTLIEWRFPGIHLFPYFPEKDHLITIAELTSEY